MICKDRVKQFCVTIHIFTHICKYIFFLIFYIWKQLNQGEGVRIVSIHNVASQECIDQEIGYKSSWCFPSQFNRSIRNTNLFFNEIQIYCSLIEIMRHVFFFRPKKKFSEIYRQFCFWGQNLFFQLFARTFFFNCL